MRIFIAGATGAIGKQLVPRLVAAGHDVHGMTRSESKQAMLYELGAVPVVADALDPDQVAEAVGRARPDLAQTLGAKKPMRVPRFIGHLLAGEAGVVMMAELRGASNDKAKRELQWRPAYPSWRQGFAAA
jgi:NAD(P)-dependent dehydrogenase (short-subunit alcohol dehydrogenase family)